jgi:hypothetical protein
MPDLSKRDSLNIDRPDRSRHAAGRSESGISRCR